MKIHIFLVSGSILTGLLASGSAPAWGPLGHSLVGIAAVESAAAGTQTALRELFAADSPQELDRAVSAACNWPDAYRETAEGTWSEPQHYVNMPRGVAVYDRPRDCPEGLCVTEAIVKYAAELGRPELDDSRRREAFAWLCHLVGDLHQPLHAGFRDDRGGNRVKVRYRGRTDDLHEFWDSMLADERLVGGLAEALALVRVAREPAPWQPGDVVAWTEESHELAATAAYPPGFTDGMEIDAAFADRSWLLTQAQWRTAAHRLAAILDTVLLPATRDP
jgi:hypothetical protein